MGERAHGDGAGDGDGAERRWILAAWVDDRFGTYGLVGCALCRLQMAKGASSQEQHCKSSEGVAAQSMVVVECLNLSCRALRRGVELAMLKRVAKEASAHGATLLALPLIESEVRPAALPAQPACARWLGRSRGSPVGDAVY